MSRHRFDFYLTQNTLLFITSPSISKLTLLILVLIILFFLSCSPTKRFTEKEEKPNKTETTEEVSKPEEYNLNREFKFNEIRVSMKGLVNSETLLIESPIYLFNENKKIALIESGKEMNCFNDFGRIRLEIDEEDFNGKIFFLSSANSEDIVKVEGKSYRGKIQILASNSSIEIVNILSLEDYVKGVLPKEMPLGKNDQNLEALKALAVCIRTYAIQKIKDGKLFFDIYADTRDQVYGGVDAERAVSNQAVEETKNLIVKYLGAPATVFYHSTCGGYTESSNNVFTKEEIPYLISVKDGSGPNCKISPRFQWEETYTRELIINRLNNFSLLDNKNYTLEDITITSRYNSGRVNELEIEVVDENQKEKVIRIKGNEIRSVLRTANNKNILWSTMFDLFVNSSYVTISGNGFGHGVGLCQWGAIALSQNGYNYNEILEFYYPGTETGNTYD